MVLILILITLIILDINRGRRNHNDLKKANQRTMEIMESRHKLLLSVSHDIKTPLNSIQGYLELMSQSSSVTAMKNASQHILSMLENLLEFSSIDQGKQHINLSDFSIQLLAQEIYEMFLPLANQKGLQLRVEAPSLNICSDRVKLKQLIINLISNAIKYTPAGEVSLHITCDKDVLAITIVDTGVVIPLEKQEQLFLPFIRLEEHHALASGTGLGLYVVKCILELLQGSITLNSQLGEGSSFTVQVPITHVQYVIPMGTQLVRVIDA